MRQLLIQKFIEVATRQRKPITIVSITHNFQEFVRWRNIDNGTADRVWDYSEVVYNQIFPAKPVKLEVRAPVWAQLAYMTTVHPTTEEILNKMYPVSSRDAAISMLGAANPSTRRCVLSRDKHITTFTAFNRSQLEGAPPIVARACMRDSRIGVSHCTPEPLPAPAPPVPPPPSTPSAHPLDNLMMPVPAVASGGDETVKAHMVSVSYYYCCC